MKSQKPSKKLLPKIGYGRTRLGGGGGGGGGSGTKINNVEFMVLSKTISGSELTVDYEMKLTQGKKTAEYTVLVESEGGLIDPKSWRNDIGTAYPIEITEVNVKSLSSTTEPEKNFSDIECSSTATEASNDFISLCLCSDNDALSEEEYRLMVEINKAFDNLSTATADNSSAVYRVNDSHSVIVADGYFTITNDNGDILDKISVSNFAKSPRAGFGKIKKAIG